MENTMVLLISDQAIPNLLSALKFRPAHIFMLHTGEPRLNLVMDNLSRYLPVILPKVVIDRIEVLANDHNSTRMRCIEICDRLGAENVVINVTCGTKLMAFGAFQAGLEVGTRVIYVDTERGKFLNLNKVKPNFPGDPGLPTLSVDDFLGIYGTRIIKEETQEALSNQERLYPLAMFMVDQHKAWTELQEFFDVIKDKLKDSLKYEGPLAIPEKGKMLQCNPDVLNAYKKAGLLSDIRVDGRNVSFCFSDKRSRDFSLRKGSLLELFTFYSIRQLQGVNDIRLDVNYSWGEDVENEMDVLVSLGPRLVCISCKSAKLKTQALTELEANANRLGGIFVRKIIVAGESVNNFSKFSNRAREMRIKVVGLDQIRKNGLESFRRAIFSEN